MKNPRTCINGSANDRPTKTICKMKRTFQWNCSQANIYHKQHVQCWERLKWRIQIHSTNKYYSLHFVFVCLPYCFSGVEINHLLLCLVFRCFFFVVPFRLKIGAISIIQTLCFTRIQATQLTHILFHSHCYYQMCAANINEYVVFFSFRTLFGWMFDVCECHGAHQITKSISYVRRFQT